MVSQRRRSGGVDARRGVTRRPEGPKLDAAMTHPANTDPPLELDTLRSLFGDDNEAIREILETYAEDLVVNLTALRAATGSRDRRAAARVAHSMKGASANVGAGPMLRLCATLEGASPAAPWEELEALARSVHDEAARVSAHVRFEVARLT